MKIHLKPGKAVIAFVFVCINIAFAYYLIKNIRSGQTVYMLLMIAGIDLTATAVICNAGMLRNLAVVVWSEKKAILELSLNDFQSKFVGSLLGRVWAFIQPIVMMSLYWFVFQVGLKAGNVKDYPFILFLMSGLIPWFYVSEVMSSGTNVLLEYSYLVKKVLFNIEILPFIKLISSLFVHLFFICFIIVVCVLYGYYPSVYSLQLFYYLACSCVFLCGMVFFFSACNAFFRDISQLVNILLTVGIWVTPIMWIPDETMPVFLKMLFMMNPVYYIVDGYRDSLLANRWFWQKPGWTVYFWCVSILINVLAIKMFNKLKPHFADVV